VSGLRARIGITRGAFELAAEVDAGPGEVVALLGPNGSGKTTVLRALAGLHALETGVIALGDRALDDPATGVFVPTKDRPVGFVFQDYLLFPHLSVLDNVAFAARSRGAGRAASRTQARPWLERLGIDDLAERRPGALSGGQAQRVALARALAADPGLLLLDEPMAALDAGTRLAVRGELRRHLSTFAGATVLVTHDPLDAMVVADRVVVLEAGRVVQSGTPGEVARRPATDYVAHLVGLNLLRGDASGAEVRLRDGGVLTVAAHDLAGPVLTAFRPEAVAVHLIHPEGSPRNVWTGVVRVVEPHGDRVRLLVDGPPSVAVVVTPGAVADLGLHPGRAVWLSLKATDVEVYPWT
jgi:molybdate transport system ATP-binding protein